MNQPTNPLVAVWMVTYNHEKYIEKAIESILAQQTRFDFKIYLGEDCSTDKTGLICQSYAERFPEKIDLVRNPANHGHIYNGVKTYDRCFASGAKFIALLEGDDYWTDPLKLQKQVAILESNQDISLVFTKVLILEDGNFKKYFSLDSNINSLDIHAQRDFFLIMKDWGPMLTCTFRKSFETSELAFPVDNFPGDFQIIFLSLRSGKIHMLDDVTGVYRVHPLSMSRTHMQQGRRQLKWEIFKYKFRFALSNKRWNTSFFLLKDYTRSAVRKSKLRGLLRRIWRRIGIKM